MIARAPVLLLALLLVPAATAAGCQSPGDGPDGEEAPAAPDRSPDEDPLLNASGFDRILSSYEVPFSVEGERAELSVDAPPHLPEILAERGDDSPRLEGVGEGDLRGPIGLVLDGVVAPPSGTYYDVYAGLPEGEAPDPSGPYHVGTLTSFGPGATQVSYDLTGVVEALAAGGRWAGVLDLTFVRRGLEGDDAPRLEGVEEPAEPLTIRTVRIVEY